MKRHTHYYLSLVAILLGVATANATEEVIPDHLPKLSSKGTQTGAQPSLKIDHFGDKIQRQFISGEKGMLAFFTIAANGEVPWHSHDAEQITHVITGEMIFTVGTDQKTYHLKEGDILVIPSNVPHKALAVKDTYEMDVFTPIRQDWLDGTDQYLKSVKK